MTKISAYSTKKRINAIGVKQRVLVKHLTSKGIVIDEPLLSNVLNGKYTMPKADIILIALDEMLTSFEKTYF